MQLNRLKYISGCLSDEQMKSYKKFNGWLMSPRQRKAIAIHLAECATCDFCVKNTSNIALPMAHKVLMTNIKSSHSVRKFFFSSKLQNAAIITSSVIVISASIAVSIVLFDSCMVMAGFKTANASVINKWVENNPHAITTKTEKVEKWLNEKQISPIDADLNLPFHKTTTIATLK
jgi:hypothetical protein